MRTILALQAFTWAYLLNAGTLPANINSNTVLNAAGSPYILSGNVTVGKGINLTVLPGTILRGSRACNLIINGELICRGKKDSLIRFDSVSVTFNSGASGYNPVTGKGSRFEYTVHMPAGSNMAIKSSKTDVFMSHSRLINVYYAVFVQSDSVDITMRNCKIEGVTNGYSIYNSYRNWKLDLTDDTIINGGYLYMGQKNNVQRCLFLGGTNTYYGLYGQSWTKEANIECNYFKRIYYGINLSSLAAGHGKFIIKNNYVDSSNYGLYMSRDFNSDSIEVTGNTFIGCFYGMYITSGTASGSAVIWKCPGNFWGSSDTVQIKKHIYDYRNFQYIRQKIDFSSYLVTLPTPCGPVPVDFTAKVKALKTPLQLVLAPNPGNGRFKILGNLTGILAWQVFDLSGKRLQQGLGDAEEEMECSLPPGTYIVHVCDSRGQQATSRLSVLK